MADSYSLVQIYYLFSIYIPVINAWIPDVQPKLKLGYEQEKLPVFFGNSTDYFKVLDQDEYTILLGARNTIYNLSLNGLIENYKQRIEWPSSDADRELCALKGKQEHDCQNYIRVFARITDTLHMFCGTNSYKPRCRYYNVINSSNSNESHKPFEIANEIEAQGRCPYNPTHNSTYIFTDGQLYSATVADFSGADPLIYREPQRTEQYDLKQLNQPAFINAIEYNGYVFFFFREIAMEYINCGKAIYSRIGRVCKNDKGGPYTSSERWTSFLKTRLNCSVPGEYPFYFNEIQATSDIIEGLHKNNKAAVIYAVFSTPINAIPGSAVCAFTIKDILAAFEGKFKSQKNTNSNWLPLPIENVPKPRPGKCVDDSRTLSSNSMNFVKTHTLMENAVPPLYGRPLLTRVSLQHRLSAITVDPQILAMDGNTYDVIFVGTDDGKILKFINVPDIKDNKNFNTIVITEIQALPIGMPVRELKVSQKTENLLVIGDGHIVSIPLYHCSKITSCQHCVKLQDPYCIWDNNNQECRDIINNRPHILSDGFIQNLNSTKDGITLCMKYENFGNQINLQQGPIVVQSTRGVVSAVGRNPSSDYSDNDVGLTNDDDDIKNTINDPLIRERLGPDGENLRMANTNIYWSFAGVVLFLVFTIGIVVGFYVSKRICKNHPFHSEHRNQLSPIARPLHPRNSGKDVNLLMNTNQFPPTPCNNKKDNLEHEFVGDKDRSHECKNSTENLEKEAHCKTGTLTKVKRTYI